MTLRVLPDAQAEIREAARWYEKKRRGLGVQLIAVVDEALERIAARPEEAAYWRADRPYRRAILRRFPYTIFYRVLAEEVEVVAFAHQRRRPGYWIGR